MFPRGSVRVSLFVTNQLNSYGKVFNTFGNESVSKVMMDRNMVNSYQNCAQFLISLHQRKDFATQVTSVSQVSDQTSDSKSGATKHLHNQSS